ncbi:DUF1501 domain-containing protein [Thalassoroseus pseudoceratinae]|uniref:DUF1501 domain-containing protein n=1 Tax=Thalassoroseus pseudoceratinae TaxID=2713176 RepID=UPI001420ED2E|nr:DUF1501 domain-containing protein [Thalassoroseus pseudoceratinae]
MNPILEYQRNLTRRSLLMNSTRPLGAAAVASLMGNAGVSAAQAATPANMSAAANGGLPSLPHFAPKAKRVIYLFMAGGPSHIDTFDYHPEIREHHGKELPNSVRGDQRITTMTSGQKSFPVVAPMFEFKQHGKHGTWVSEILPNVAKVVDDMTIIKSVHTEAINHDPAITYINTGFQQPGKATMGAWVSYGLGSPNKNLPAYIVMISKGPGQKQALYSRLWGSGFLPSKHQGVALRAGAEPVLYLNDPPGIDRKMRRRMLDRIAKINQQHYEEFGDPETQTRIAQYEMAFRMQTSVPDLMEMTDEPKSTYDLYGPEAKKPGSFTRNCIIARRLAERGVPFIQLFHRGWDQHGSLPKLIRGQCETIDQGAAALIKDLKQRGMFEDTLVVWGGEFGRTIYSQGKLTADNHGRDHHGRSFTMWMAGAGIKRGFEFGRTDDYSYNIVENPVHIRDMSATILHQLGIDHERLTFRYQGLDQSLTGTEPARVIDEILV